MSSPNRMAGVESIRTEIETYERMKPQLLKRGRGKFVLLRGTKVIGLYATREGALKAGHRRFGSGPFVIHQVLAREPVFVI